MTMMTYSKATLSPMLGLCQKGGRLWRRELAQIMQTIASAHHPYLCRVGIKLQTLCLSHVQCHQISFYQINMCHIHYSTYPYILEFSNNEQYISRLFPFFGVILKNGYNGCFPPPWKQNRKIFFKRKYNNGILLGLTVNNVFTVSVYIIECF